MPAPIIQPLVFVESPIENHDLPDENDELFRLDQFDLFSLEQGIKSCGSDSMLIEVLTLMTAKEIPNDLEQMKLAFDSNDYAQVEYLAHKIKGSAIYAGTTRMKYACQYLERYWKTGGRKLFHDLYHQTVKIIQLTTDYVTVWLGKNSRLCEA